MMLLTTMGCYLYGGRGRRRGFLVTAGVRLVNLHHLFLEHLLLRG